jgi:hypothetical protein
MDEFMIWLFRSGNGRRCGSVVERKRHDDQLCARSALSGLSLVVAQYGAHPGAEGAGR